MKLAIWMQNAQVVIILFFGHGFVTYIFLIKISENINLLNYGVKNQGNCARTRGYVWERGVLVGICGLMVCAILFCPF